MSNFIFYLLSFVFIFIFIDLIIFHIVYSLPANVRYMARTFILYSALY